MFEWNSLNPWGAGFNEIVFTMLLGIVCVPFYLVGKAIAGAWRKRHPREKMYF